MVYFLTNKFLLQKFQPEKYDFELYKDYLHEENGPNSPDFEGKKSQVSRFSNRLWMR
jgi:hypothetical protein